MIYLADKSALARMHVPAVAARMNPLFEADQVATCGLVDLEILYSALNRANFNDMWRGQQSLPRAPVGDNTISRAVGFMARLSDTGRHRRPIADLIIAAAAEAAGMTVLHYDKDFEIIAEVCDLQHEWVVPRGSI